MVVEATCFERDGELGGADGGFDSPVAVVLIFVKGLVELESGRLPVHGEAAVAPVTSEDEFDEELESVLGGNVSAEDVGEAYVVVDFAECVGVLGEKGVRKNPLRGWALNCDGLRTICKTRVCQSLFTEAGDVDVLNAL